MTVLYSIAEIRTIEQAAIAQLGPHFLMQRAGQAAATMGLTLISTRPEFANILVLAGPGNNGGDALECACRLALAGASVRVALCTTPGKKYAESAQALQNAQSSKVQFLDLSCMTEAIECITTTRWNLIVDGLFGIGLKHAIDGELRMLVNAVNTHNIHAPCPVLALDIPSGLNADTGNIVSDGKEHGCAILASHTITFIADKPGLHTCHGRDYAGQVLVDALDIDARYFTLPNAFLNGTELFSRCLRARPHNSHKGSYGDITVVGGARGMAGAPILSARAALHCGAGRVFIAFCDDAPAYDSTQPELMCRNANEFDFSSTALVAGPGLGASPQSVKLLIQILNANTPLVLDADALNLIAANPDLQLKTAQRTAKTLMTPHPLEAARLLGLSSAQVQTDRPAAARQLASQFNSNIILKGSGTVIADPNGMIVVNNTGNAALATAGTGDVLAGMCGALLAQDWPAWEAALAAVWIHGRAADDLARQGVGPVGMTASELISGVRVVLNRLIAERSTNKFET